MNDNFPPEALTQILKAFTDAGTENINALQQVRDVQVIMGSLLQHEAKRLEKKLGRENLRVQQVQASIKRNQAISRDLDVELEIAKIRVPEVNSEDSLIHGRVVDENRRGLAGLVVSLANIQGTIIPPLGNTQTQNSGYYALIINAEALEKNSQSIQEGVFVVVCNSKGELIYRQKDFIILVGGERILVEDIVLKRADLSPVCGGKQPPETPPKDDQTPSEREAWVVRGRVIDENGQGMAGLMVSALDRDRRYDDKLGSALTNREGEFRITYRIQDFREGLEPGSDLYVTVIDINGNLLYSSIDNIRENASREEVYEIRLDRGDRT